MKTVFINATNKGFGIETTPLKKLVSLFRKLSYRIFENNKLQKHLF